MKRIVAGTRAVVEALRANRGAVAAVYIEEGGTASHDEVVRAARHADVPCEERSRAELDALAQGVRHQGVLAIGGDYPYLDLDTLLDKAGPNALLVALDEITDPYNFGAIIRSAVALGAPGIITLKHRAAPVTPVVVRASAGATEHARIARVANLSRALEELAERGFETIGLDAEGTVTLSDLPPASSGRVLVIGSEGKGLRRLVREHCQTLARIDLSGPIASLNASVAAAIALYEVSRKHPPSSS